MWDELQDVDIDTKGLLTQISISCLRLLKPFLRLPGCQWAVSQQSVHNCQLHAAKQRWIKWTDGINAQLIRPKPLCILYMVARTRCGQNQRLMPSDQHIVVFSFSTYNWAAVTVMRMIWLDSEDKGHYKHTFPLRSNVNVTKPKKWMLYIQKFSLHNQCALFMHLQSRLYK